MVVTDAGRCSDVNDEQLLKALWKIEVRVLGKLIEVMPLQEVKALHTC